MNSVQQEQLLNVGAYLQSVRKEKGKTVDEVANQIFIRPALVRAIEAGDWETLPEPVFVQGFIRRYAEHLGLNGREVSQQFEPTPVSVLPNPELANSGSVEGIVKQQDRHGLKVLSKAEPTHNGSSFTPVRASKTGNSWGWLLGVVALGAITGLIALLTTRNTPQQAASPETTEESVTPAEPEESSDLSAAEGTAPVEAGASDTTVAGTTEAEGAIANTPLTGSPITFAVNIEEDAWMRVTADGEEVYEGILTAGAKESWTADSELSVTAGNSGSVMYSFNGSEEVPMGSPGSVSSLTLTPETDPQALQTQ
ncbi:DUF4115 domain-containing protein [Oscillatoria sp. CS-180]|uniref:helix-turn-helix domain-containing protein n=1 Tax=Oscillatoria sp. CS-180 TaxID=3021720 RepID=UPI00232D74B9|nr:RodZ domain-containing protein [Oscillatoria sp. CS-180]MDB9527064.1 DUF4115 domain-containing protein [Oscillatoria sp. CS-180]